MLAFIDSISEAEGKNTARMNFRTKEPIKATIQRAAAISGVDDSTFTMNAAYREAQEIISAHERTKLDAIDHEAFFSALDSGPSPSKALIATADRYSKRTVSR